MYHSITLGTKNTWDDWHLIPTSRPVINPPSVKTNLIEIPGGDGVLDLTTALSGRPLYKNRVGSWEFYVENGYREWTTLYSDIMVYLHGQKMRAVLEDDPMYYYEGRFAVNAWKSNKERSVITIDYDVNPYKKEIFASTDEWIWDTFNFETGVIRYYKDLPVDGTLEIVVITDLMPTSPTLVVSASGMRVTYGGETYALSKGINHISEIVLSPGENLMTFSGNGIVTIEFTGGRLLSFDGLSARIRTLPIFCGMETGRRLKERCLRS